MLLADLNEATNQTVKRFPPLRIKYLFKTLQVIDLECIQDLLF